MQATAQVNIRLPYQLARRVDRISVQRGITRTRAYIQLIERALEQDPEGKLLDLAPELEERELLADQVKNW